MPQLFFQSSVSRNITYDIGLRNAKTPRREDFFPGCLTFEALLLHSNKIFALETDC